MRRKQTVWQVNISGERQQEEPWKRDLSSLGPHSPLHISALASIEKHLAKHLLCFKEMLTKRPRRSMPKVRTGCSTCKWVKSKWWPILRLTQQDPSSEMRRGTAKMPEMCIYRPYLSRVSGKAIGDHNRNIQPSFQGPRKPYRPRDVALLPQPCGWEYLQAIRLVDLVRAHYAAKPVPLGCSQCLGLS